MNPTELDERLSAMARSVSSEASSQAIRLVDATMPRHKRTALRRRWVLPVLAGGAIALTAGAATATAVMSHWAGVSMPLENVRNNEPIPVTWTTETGHTERCRAYIELRNADPGDQAKLDSAITSRDWSGLGQRLFDNARAATDDPDGEIRVSDGLGMELRSFANETFPGVGWLSDAPRPSARAVDAWGMRCSAEVDG